MTWLTRDAPSKPDDVRAALADGVREGMAGLGLDAAADAKMISEAVDRFVFDWQDGKRPPPERGPGDLGGLFADWLIGETGPATTQAHAGPTYPVQSRRRGRSTALRHTAVDTSPAPRFDLWIPAVETGLLPLPRLIAWADEQIMRLREPPRWLLELSLATSVDGIERAREYVPESGGREQFDRRRIYLGSLYLAFERGLLPMDKMLLEAGQFSECCGSNAVPECEAFYLLLNEIDGGGPTRPSNRPLAERVQELFAPLAEDARAALVGLPGGTVAV